MFFAKTNKEEGFMKFFKTTGPVNPQEHYYVAHRIDEKQIQELIDKKEYFVLHAPRQSGKTTWILASVERLNKEGRYKALYVNIEPAQVAKDDVPCAIKIILGELYASAARYLDKSDHLFTIIEKELKSLSVVSLQDVLCQWSEASDKPIILYVDEIDLLTGESLVSVLSQLRAGYIDRQRGLPFPRSIGLIGLRDVSDYHPTASPFNVAASITLPNFSQEQIQDLYIQHTQETGQEFTDEAIVHAFYLTQGQPWLVNALAHEACLLEKEKPITKEIIEQAKEVLVLRRSTHIRSLSRRLEEPRVRYIIDAIISGSEDAASNFKAADLQYLRDVGMIGQKGMHIANPIYQQIIPRKLSQVMQAHFE